MLPLTEGINIMNRLRVGNGCSSTNHHGTRSMNKMLLKLELEDPVITTTETTLTNSPTNQKNHDDKYMSAVSDDKYTLRGKSIDKYTLQVTSNDSSDLAIKNSLHNKQNQNTETVIREEPVTVIQKKDLTGWRKLMKSKKKYKSNKLSPNKQPRRSDSSSYTQSTSISDITPSSSVWYDKTTVTSALNNENNGAEEEEEEEEAYDDIGSSLAELIVDFISCSLCDMDVYDDGSSEYSESSVPRVVRFRNCNKHTPRRR